jgi:cation/acetate symporter
MNGRFETQKSFVSRLKKVYAWYTAGFIAFVCILGVLEQMGLDRVTMGYVFMAATILLYAGIGVMSRTSDVDEYYVAGRRVPAVFNGMATGADWMSAASFIGMAGGLYLQGYSGLAFIMGWTGGYVLVALFLAPFLRKFGRFTIPDFLGARYGGNVPRLVGVVIAIACSFTYVVAQIYGVGLITTRLTGVDFGVFVLGRHEGCDLDPSRSIHHPDYCLPNSRDLAFRQANWRTHSTASLWLTASKGVGARGQAHQ